MFKRNCNWKPRDVFTCLKENMKRISSYICKSREAIGYYAFLLLILAFLSTAAYQYRNASSEPTDTMEYVMQESLPPVLSSERVFAELFPEETEELPVWPVSDGHIVRGYSGTNPVWFTELEMWQIHEGVDFEAAPGEAVFAILSGTITDVYSDPLYGNTVVVDHGEGRIVEYASLITLKLAERGAKVKAGDVVGAAGTCPAEAGLGTHIHIKYSVNGNTADITELLKEESEDER